MTDTLPRQERVPLTEAVAGLFEEKILTGEWEPGRRLPSEPDLGVQLGVSRSVIRDAMKSLAARGLVDVRQGAGTQIAQPSAHAYASAILMLLRRSGLTVGDILEARELIEIGLAGLAASRRTEDDCVGLRGCLDRYRAAVDAVDWDATLEAHTAFHLAILSAVHAPALEILLSPMHEIVLAAPLPPIRNEKSLWDVPLHYEIFFAIEAKDRDAARAQMTKHFAFRNDPLYAEEFARLFRDVPGGRR
jgi:DNA-binding FadR family transcriptional regulator